MSIDKLISTMPLFANFSEKEKKIVAEFNQSIVCFNKGEKIIQQGDENSFYPLFLIIEGSVSVQKRGCKRPLCLLKSGAIFGEMSFLSNRPRSTDIVAEEDIKIMKLDDEFLNKIPLNLKDKIKDHLIELLVCRLDNMNNSFKELSRIYRGFQIKKQYGEW